MHIQKKEQRVMEVIVQDYYKCDKCAMIIKVPMYDAFECTIEMRTGTAYPEGGTGETTEIHLCPECAPKLFTFLKEAGYAINRTEWDW